MNEALDARILAAHDADDKSALVKLYSQAADSANDVDTTCFFLTYAYIFALELGLDEANRLHSQLVAHGREE